ncbi:hypothetical protein AJ80_07847 [Polytolypa hystricis UAMH7299]|uniref:Tat pathway signal sequence n=1 Tax=Polytolypa hystricis (strain UAMH7299) TaxID=1447883 RepID=A0A2B7XIR2_POLH7|nr:hypothetical protein AJ80_07847 [Polytolypa hystricis UAMH7299]
MKDEDDIEEPLLERVSWDEQQRKYQTIIFVQWAIILTISAVLAGSLSYFAGGKKVFLPPNHIYSPAQDAVRYKRTTFTTGFEGGLSKYQGPPSAENEKAWDELYGYGISRIPESQAKKLVDKTLPIPGDPGYYIAGLDVFHQLHCLNMLRKYFWAAELGLNKSSLMHRAVDKTFERSHMDHCIDAVRQSLMCSADIAPITWAWSERDHMGKASANSNHTCRDFDRLMEWGKANRVKNSDPLMFLEHPLKD